MGCPVCQSARSRSFARSSGREYRDCRACRTIYLSPRPTDEEVAALHGGGYAASHGHDVDSGVRAAKHKTASRYLRMLGEPSGKLLEVGCSTGDALSLAAAMGWHVTGVEPDPDAAQRGNRRLGRHCIHPGRLQDVELASESFSAVMMLDVIEHFARPHQVLQRLHGLLKPGATLLMVTPDVGALSRYLMGKRWPHLIPEHVILYSRTSLTQLAEDCGFRVETVSAAVKYASTSLFRRHVELYPQVFGAFAVRRVTAVLPEWVLPMPMGEMVLVATKVELR